MAWRAVTDKQWALIREQLPERPRRKRGGRPSADDRKCFEGVLWILWTGAPWSELPPRYGSKSTVHRRLKEWAEGETLLDMWRAFLDQLEDRKKVRWDECFIDGMFVTAKKGGAGREDQARQGNEAHGTGRWRGYSARSTRGGGGSPPRRADA